MTTPVQNNYARQVEQARASFLRFDQAAMCRRLGLPMTDDAIPIRFLGEPHRVLRADGRVLRDDGAPASFAASMTIYDALGRTGAPPRLRGDFVPTSALHGIHGTHSVHEDLDGAGAKAFAGRAAALDAALAARGGRPWGKGDVSRIIDVFDFFPVCVRFWDADDEFPAALQFFWDANALDFLCYETLWFVMGELRSQLEEAVAALEA